MELHFPQITNSLADPEDYRYCGYAEALAKGPAVAHEGIRIILDLPQTTCWKELGREYGKHLFLRGAPANRNNPPAFEFAKAQEVVDQVGLIIRQRCLSRRKLELGRSGNSREEF